MCDFIHSRNCPQPSQLPKARQYGGNLIFILNFPPGEFAAVKRIIDYLPTKKKQRS